MNNYLDKLIQNSVNVIAFTIGLFHLLNVSGILVLSTRDIRIFHLMMMLALLFLTNSTFKRFEKSIYEKYASIALIAVSTASCIFIMSRWKDIAMSGGDTDALDF